jgi:hypothetical protein
LIRPLQFASILTCSFLIVSLQHFALLLMLKQVQCSPPMLVIAESSSRRPHLWCSPHRMIGDSRELGSSVSFNCLSFSILGSIWSCSTRSLDGFTRTIWVEGGSQRFFQTWSGESAYFFEVPIHVALLNDSIHSPEW